jgi:hypothetical protein
MPYLYLVLRDIFYTNLVNKENIQKIQRGWDYMAQQFAELVTTFWTFYRHLKHYKVLIRHFRRYPEYLKMITEFERLIASFTEPKDLHHKTTPPPRPEKVK